MFNEFDKSNAGAQTPKIFMTVSSKSPIFLSNPIHLFLVIMGIFCAVGLILGYFYLRLNTIERLLYIPHFIVLFVGIPFCCIALMKIFTVLSFRSKGQLAKGKVVNILTVRGNRGFVLQPLIEFRTFDGIIMTTSTYGGSKPSMYHIGEELELYYDPTNPSNTLVKNFSEQWLLSSVFGVISLLLFGLVIYFLAIIRF